jgi:hypothetical protein
MHGFISLLFGTISLRGACGQLCLHFAFNLSYCNGFDQRIDKQRLYKQLPTHEPTLEDHVFSMR